MSNLTSGLEEQTSLSSGFENHKKYKKFIQYKQSYQVLDGGLPFFQVYEGVNSNRIRINNRDLINYSSYNYLGLNGHEYVKQYTIQAIQEYGTSVSASRIVSGESSIHSLLEKSIAEFLGTEDAVVMVSGHSTNVNLIGDIFNEADLIIHDQFIHNSILEGCRLSGAKRMSFSHNNLEQLEKILSQSRHKYNQALICVEGVYSMDGDLPDLVRLVELKEKYNCFILVDEAHSIGTVGKTGRGILEYYNLPARKIDFLTGTMSKSFASCGGYVAGSKALIKYIKYNCPGFVYSVGISPQNAAPVIACLKLIQNNNSLVSKLQENADLFRKLAVESELNIGLSHDSPVVPIIIGDAIICLQIQKYLAEHRINVFPILYPAISRRSERLRFFITSSHTREEIEYTIDMLKTAVDIFSISPTSAPLPE
jgi:8-amino-7-oxononanoate synthase